MGITPHIRRVLIKSKLDQIFEVAHGFDNVIDARVLNSAYENEKIDLSLRKESPYKLSIAGVLVSVAIGLIVAFLGMSRVIMSDFPRLLFWCFVFSPLVIYLLYYRYIKKQGVFYYIEVRPADEKDIYIMEIRGSEESGDFESVVQSDVKRLFDFMSNKSVNFAELPKEAFTEWLTRAGKEAEAQKKAKEKARQEAIEQARRKVGLDQEPVGEVSKVKSIDQREKKSKCKCPNPDCGKTYFVKAHNLGRRAKCKNCGESFVLKPCEDNPNH